MSNNNTENQETSTKKTKKKPIEAKLFRWKDRNPLFEMARKYGRRKYIIIAVWTYMFWRSGKDNIFDLAEKHVLYDIGITHEVYGEIRKILIHEGFLVATGTSKKFHTVEYKVVGGSTVGGAADDCETDDGTPDDGADAPTVVLHASDDSLLHDPGVQTKPSEEKLRQAASPSSLCSSGMVGETNKDMKQVLGMFDDDTRTELLGLGYTEDIDLADYSRSIDAEFTALTSWITDNTSIRKITEPEKNVIRLLLCCYPLRTVYDVLDDTLRNRVKSVAKNWNSLSVLFKHWKLNWDLTEKSRMVKLATAAAKKNKLVSEIDEKVVLFSNEFYELEQRVKLERQNNLEPEPEFETGQ